MPPRRSEGMTAATTAVCHPAGTPALMSATTHTSCPRRTTSPTSPSPHSVRRAASASRPCGRYAVGLPPRPDPDAYLSASTRRRRGPKQSSQDPLTGPAPSGMTCTPWAQQSTPWNNAVLLHFSATRSTRNGPPDDVRGAVLPGSGGRIRTYDLWVMSWGLSRTTLAQCFRSMPGQNRRVACDRLVRRGRSDRFRSVLVTDLVTFEYFVRASHREAPRAAATLSR
jgi:hypothetical protein